MPILAANVLFFEFSDGHCTHLAQSLRSSRSCFGDENRRTIQIKYVVICTREFWSEFLDSVHFFVPLGLRATLTDWGVDGARVTELNWGDTHVHRVGRTGVNVTILCTPAQHWSQRSVLDRCKVRVFIVQDGAHSAYRHSGRAGRCWRRCTGSISPATLAFVNRSSPNSAVCMGRLIWPHCRLDAMLPGLDGIF